MKCFKEFSVNYVDVFEGRKRKSANDILCFDIEVSSAWYDGCNIIGYEKGRDENYWNSLEPLSLCYIWQFSFNENVYYGRELKDFIFILNELSRFKDITFFIYVHNLSYEFQFLINILQPFKQIFARASHKVIYFISELYPNIEFRCSYFLTRLSLSSWGDNVGVHKLKGDLDYNILRTPKTNLTKKELGYCKRDVVVMYEGLKKYRDKYKCVEKIPLTQTGEVRREVKKRMVKQKGWLYKVAHMLPHDCNEYRKLFRTFQGGYTHSNYNLSGRVIENVESYDIASSYPFVMISEKFPMTPFYVRKFNENDIDKYAYMLKVKFVGIGMKLFNHYISYSKCMDVVNPVIDNGRIMQADELTMYITELDFEIIKKAYYVESYEIIESYASRKAYLPKVFIDYVLELYENKTKLKSVKGSEDVYMQSKQYINSMFGMCVTALVQEGYVFNDGKWVRDLKTEDDINEFLNNVRECNKAKVFLNYAWGIWITAYARRNIWKCIIKYDDDVIYVDTDSVKMRNPKHDLTWYNMEVIDKLEKTCRDNGLDIRKCKPLNPNGKECVIGFLESEGLYQEFITLGAKRYCYRDSEGMLNITVSGVNKGAVKCLNDDINNFKDGFKFDKDNDSVTTMLITYINDQPLGLTWNKGKYDEYVNTQYKYGINARNKGYEMSIKDDYACLIGKGLNTQSIFEEWK